jgi:hypothetical protein
VLARRWSFATPRAAENAIVHLGDSAKLGFGFVEVAGDLSEAGLVCTEGLVDDHGARDGVNADVFGCAVHELSEVLSYRRAGRGVTEAEEQVADRESTPPDSVAWFAPPDLLDDLAKA